MTKRTLIVEVLPKGFKELAAAIDGLGKASSNVNTSIKSVGATVQSVEDRVSKYAQRFSTYTKSLRAYAAEISAIAAAIKSIQIPSSGGGIASGLKEAAAQSKQLVNNIKQAEKAQVSAASNQKAQLALIAQAEKDIKAIKKAAIDQEKAATREIKEAFAQYVGELKSADRERTERIKQRRAIEKEANAENKAFLKEFNASLAEGEKLAKAQAIAQTASSAKLKSLQDDRLAKVQSQLKIEKEIKAVTENAAASARSANLSRVQDAEKRAKIEKEAASVSLASQTKSLQDTRLKNTQERLKLEKEAASVEASSNRDSIQALARKRLERQRELEEVKKIVAAEKDVGKPVDAISSQRERIAELERKIELNSLTNKERELTLTNRLLQLEQKRAQITGEPGSGFVPKGGVVESIRQGFQLAGVSADIKKTSNDLDELERATRRGRKGLLDFSNVARVAVGNIIAITSTEIIFGFRRLVENILKSASTLQDYGNKIKLVTREFDSLSVTQSKLFDLSRETRTSFAGTVEIFTRMARATESLNISQERLFRITETVNKATIISGANAREAEQGLIQLAQGIASNRLSGDEFRSISEQLPEITRILADSLGVTRGQLRLLAQEGVLTAEVVVSALEGAAEEVDAKFGKTTKTIGQSFEILKTTALQRLAKDLDVVSKSVIGVVDAVTNNFDDIVTAIQNIIGLLGLLAARLAAGAAWASFSRFVYGAGGALQAFSKIIAGLGGLLLNPLTIALVLAPAAVKLIHDLANKGIEAKIRINPEAVTESRFDDISREAAKKTAEFVQGKPDFLGQTAEVLTLRARIYEKFFNEIIAQDETFNTRLNEIREEIKDGVKEKFAEKFNQTDLLRGNIVSNTIKGAVAAVDKSFFLDFNIAIEKLITGKSTLEAQIVEQIKKEAEVTAEQEKQKNLLKEQQHERDLQADKMVEILDLAQGLNKIGVNIGLGDLDGLSSQALDKIKNQVADIQNEFTSVQEQLSAGSLFELSVTEKKLSLLENVGDLKGKEGEVQKRIASEAAKVLVIYEDYLDVAKDVFEIQETGLKEFKKGLTDINVGLKDEGRSLQAELAGGLRGKEARAEFEVTLKFEDAFRSFEDDVNELRDRVKDIEINADATLDPKTAENLKKEINQQISGLQGFIDVQMKIANASPDGDPARLEQISDFKRQIKDLKDIRDSIGPGLDTELAINRFLTILEKVLGISREITKEESLQAIELEKQNRAAQQAINRSELSRDAENLEKQIKAAEVSEEAFDIEKKRQELLKIDLGLSAEALANEAARITALEKQLELTQAGIKARKEADKQFKDDIGKFNADFGVAVGRARAQISGGDTGARIFEAQNALDDIFKEYAKTLNDVENNTADQIRENQKLIEAKREEINALKKLVPLQVKYLETLERVSDTVNTFSGTIEQGFDQFFDTLVRSPKRAFKEFMSTVKDGFLQLGADILKEVFDPLRESLKDFASGIAESLIEGGGLKETLLGGLKGIFGKGGSLQNIGKSLGGIFGEGGAAIGGNVLPVAAAAFAGVKVGSGISNLLGLKKGSAARGALTGASGGAAAGAVAGTLIFPGIGTAVGAAIGAVVGAISGVLKSLFTGQPSNKFARGALNLGSLSIGSLAQKDNSKETQENVDARTSFFDGLKSVLGLFKDLSGGKFSGDIIVEVNRRDGIVIGFGGFTPKGGPNNAQSFQDPDAAFRTAIAIALKQTTGADPVFTGFLRSSLQVSSTAEEISKGLETLGNAMAFLKKPTSEWKTALDGINAAFGPLIEKAKQTGQSLTTVTTALNAALDKLRTEFVKDAKKQELALTNPVAASFFDLVEKLNQRTADAAEIGTAPVIDAAKSLNAAELKSFIDEFANGIDSIIESLDPFTVNETLDAIKDFKAGFLAIIDAAKQAGGAFAQNVQSLTTQLNAKLSLLRQKFDQSINDEIAASENPQASALRQILKEQAESLAIAKELGANVNRVFDLTALKIEDLVEAASSDPEALTNLAEGISALVSEMEAAGQSVDLITEAFRRAQDRIVVALNEGYSERILSITQPTLQSFRKLLEQQKQELNVAAFVGADTFLLQQAQALERKKFLDGLSDEELASLGDFLGLIEDFSGKIAVVLQQVNDIVDDQINSFKNLADAAKEAADNFDSIAESIRSTIDSIEGQFSSGPPGERLANLRLKFQSTFEAAQAGDASALEKLPGIGNEIISQSRQLFGGTERFQTDLNFVLGILKTSERIALEKATEERARADAILKQVDLLTEIRDILGTQGLKPEDLAALIAQVDPANTGLLPLINQLLTLLYSNQTNLGSVSNFLQDPVNGEAAVQQLLNSVNSLSQSTAPAPLQFSSQPIDAITQSGAQSAPTTTQTEQSDNIAIMVGLTEQTNDKLDEILRATRVETTVNENAEREIRRMRAVLERLVNEQNPQQSAILREILAKDSIQ